MFTEFKQVMMSGFQVSNLGKMRYFLGLNIEQHDQFIFISH